jgi:hypothetical protein
MRIPSFPRGSFGIAVRPPTSDVCARVRLAAATLALLILLASIGQTLAVATDGLEIEAAAAGSGHLLLSEVMTGGTSASDEFVELYNPTSAELPLEGLELVYVSASGATVTRKAAWAAGAPGIAAGGHLLIANEAGVFAAVADAGYANGLAATGGSVALRIIGASTAIDAVGWGSAASTWLETQPAPAPAAGESLERLPGGSLGSGQDTDDNLLDFVVNSAPDPQNSASPPIQRVSSPSASGSASASPSSPLASGSGVVSPSPSATTTPTTTPTPTATTSATPTPTPGPISIAEARALPDGSLLTIEATALTGSAFTDGGGYVSDESGGIAVLLADGAYDRGALLVVTGTVGDRYGQRTVRSDASGVVVVGEGSEPMPVSSSTGTIGEAVEGRLVRIAGSIVSSATVLSAGIAFDVDDGSGPVRVLLNGTAGIDADAWQRGAKVDLVGVVGQRDSGGTGSGGYRVQPRDAADIVALDAAPSSTPSPTPVPTATPTPAATATVTPTPTATQDPDLPPLVSVADARDAPRGTALRVRGVVTLSSGQIDPVEAVIQDATAGILIRISDDVGQLRRGQLVELAGVTSTKSGMVSLRVAEPPLVLGGAAEPEFDRSSTGALGEALEARLVAARGAITSSARRSPAGTVSRAIDDGSGEVRVVVPSGVAVDLSSLAAGAWVEVAGVLGQETTGAQPERGYRIWIREADDLRVLAPVAAGAGRVAGTPTNASTGHGTSGHVAATAPLPGSPRPGPQAGPAEHGDLPAPVLTASASGHGARASATSVAVANLVLHRSADPLPGSDPLRGLGLLVVAVAILLSVAMLALRSGAARRILEAVRPAMDAGAPPQMVPEVAPEPVPLTVMRGRGRQP